MLDSEYIKSIALGVGFDLCGIASVRDFRAEVAMYRRWLDDGFGARLGYLARNVDKRSDVRLLVPGARSVVVCAVSYKNDTSLGYGTRSNDRINDRSGAGGGDSQSGAPEPGGSACAHIAKVASYARARDYHPTIKGMLGEVARRLGERYGELGLRTFCDTAPVLEKQWAVEAGLAFRGRNSLAVSPVLGSFMLLGEIVVDVETDHYDAPLSGVGCGACRRCVDACPNGAITPSGVDARRCIACLTIEKRVGADAASEACGNGGDAAYGAGGPCNGLASEVSLDGWIFGCDACQSVCPYNLAAPDYTNPAFAPVFDPRDITPAQWLAMTPTEFTRRFGATPLARAGLDRIKESLPSNSL